MAQCLDFGPLPVSFSLSCVHMLHPTKELMRLALRLAKLFADEIIGQTLYIYNSGLFYNYNNDLETCQIDCITTSMAQSSYFSFRSSFAISMGTWTRYHQASSTQRPRMWSVFKEALSQTKWNCSHAKWRRTSNPQRIISWDPKPDISSLWPECR